MASGIDSEVADLEHFFLDAKRPAQERPDSREQFLRGKGLGSDPQSLATDQGAGL